MRSEEISFSQYIIEYLFVLIQGNRIRLRLKSKNEQKRLLNSRRIRLIRRNKRENKREKLIRRARH